MFINLYKSRTLKDPGSIMLHHLQSYILANHDHMWP